MNTLYLCYQSLLEPLTQTQVLPYLEGLAQAGYRIVLLTFEPRRPTAVQTRQWRQRLAAQGIVWHWCRYHKRPTVLATGWDVVRGVLAGLRLIHRHKVRLLHARAHVAGVMALVLKRLTRAKLLFDIRGLMAEEYADAGVWPPDGALFRLTKYVERVLVEAADGIVVLTEKARQLFLRWYPHEIADKPLMVVPCCVDFRNVPPREAPGGTGVSPVPGRTHGQDARGTSRFRCSTVLVYVGKLDGWYPTDAMAALMAAAVQMIPGSRWQVWTQSDPLRLRRLLTDQGINGQVTVGSIAADALPAVLAGAHAGLSLRRPGPAALAASPTKVGEYLAAGLPVITSRGVGDTDALLTGEPSHGRAAVGVVVQEFTAEAYRLAIGQLVDLLNDPGTPRRCRAVARKHLDLQRVGWARYRQLYDTLIGTARGS
jgi:glycosyltransferase involved in cell wall biosynthesis